jgi:hypothetical protein
VTSKDIVPLSAAFLLGLCTVLSAFLVHRGALSSHVFSAMLGASVAWAALKVVPLFRRKRMPLPLVLESDPFPTLPSPPPPAAGTFTVEEVPTKRDLRNDAITVPVRREDRKIFKKDD